MDSQQIEKALSRHPATKNIFLGVFASDALLESVQVYPAAFIANVDTSTEPGSHWIAFFITSPEKVEFFDSYGHPPSAFPGPLLDYANSFEEMNYNPQTLQSNVTAVCGHYCIYFIYSRSRGKTLQDILLSFVPKQLQNDRNIYNFVSKYFKMRTQFYQ